MTKKVNVLWQCLATILIPTGIYAFKRINKLKDGIIIYAITLTLQFLMPISTNYMWYDFNYDLYLVTFAVFTLFSVIASFIIPILYMNKWSKEYNAKLDNQITKTS